MPMLTKSNNRQVEKGVRSIQTSTAYGQPWWQGLGSNDMPSSGQQENSSVDPASAQPQGSVEGVPKDIETNAALHSGTLSKLNDTLYIFSCLNALYIYCYL